MAVPFSSWDLGSTLTAMPAEWSPSHVDLPAAATGWEVGDVRTVVDTGWGHIYGGQYHRTVEALRRAFAGANFARLAEGR
jgi:hypothetical protein